MPDTLPIDLPQPALEAVPDGRATVADADLLRPASHPSQGRPLLTVAIPTYNRSPFLAELLEVLLVQLADQPQAELLISDNASTDSTTLVVQSFLDRGLRARYLRSPENRGSDANFLQCLDQAGGKYVWLLGDDDLLTPNAVRDLLSLLRQGERQGADFDLVYLSSVGFSGTYRQPSDDLLTDKLGRFAEVVTDGPYLLEKVNALIGLISVVIINRDRLRSIPHPAISSLTHTNLIQVGWIFPLLQRRCRVLYVWRRLVAYRSHNSAGWGICEVFGLRLRGIADRYFVEQPQLAQSLMNGVLRYWLTDSIMLARNGREPGMRLENFAQDLRPAFRRNWRFWAFVYPVATLRLPLARLLHRAVLRPTNKLTRATQALLRHLFRRGEYLEPTPHS